MPMDAWTNVAVFWQELLNALESYVSTGRGQGEFSEETAIFSLAKRGTIAVFELRGRGIRWSLTLSSRRYWGLRESSLPGLKNILEESTEHAWRELRR